MMGKRKVETPAQRTARLEPVNLFLVGAAMHPWVSRTSVFLAGHFTQALFHTFLQKHNVQSAFWTRLHAHIMYRPHPLA